MELKLILTQIRLNHSVKNLLVFCLPASAGMLFNHANISLFEFLSLTLSSGFNYIINDFLDLEIDRSNPAKLNRPIVSGKLSVRKAFFTAFCLFFLFILINLFFLSFHLFLLNLLFLGTQLSYSIYFKNVAIMEIFILSSLYVFRALVPYSYISVNFSFWFFNIVLFGAMFIVLLKRKGEFISNLESSRRVLGFYTKNFLESWVLISLIGMIITFSLWTEELYNQSRSPFAFILIVPIIVSAMRLTLESNSLLLQSSVKLILRDRIIVACFIFFAISYYRVKGFI